MKRLVQTVFIPPRKIDKENELHPRQTWTVVRSQKLIIPVISWAASLRDLHKRLSAKLSRRCITPRMKHFFHSSLLFASLFCVHLQAATPLDDSLKVGGFAIGCQAYSFNRYTAFEAIEKTREAGG